MPAHRAGLVRRIPAVDDGEVFPGLPGLVGEHASKLSPPTSLIDLAGRRLQTMPDTFRSISTRARCLE